MSRNDSRGRGMLLTVGLIGMALTFLVVVLDESRHIDNPLPMVVLGVGALLFGALMRGPIGKAVGRMLDDDTSGGDEQLAMRVEDLEARLQELSLEQSRVMELEGRIDFAERMLLKEPRRDAPLGGTHGAAQ